MAAVTNPWSFTYGARQVGGSTDYQLHDAYALEKSFEQIRFAFDIVIVATSFETLQSLSEALEDDFRKRDQTLVIDLDGNAWTYTFGADILNSKATLTKSGDKEKDQGFARSYTCVVEGGLPADGAGDNGLQDITVSVSFAAGRQKTVGIRGIYTASVGVTAVAQYLAQIDAEVATILTAIDGSATFEKVAENFDQDRNIHMCGFTRQYRALLANQSIGSLDDPDIKEHRMVFTQVTAHPGDSVEGIHRMRRVKGTYDCAVDITVTTDLQAVLENKIKPHLKALFQTNFSPQVFAIEDFVGSQDETSKRISAAIQFIYQTAEGGDVVEVTQSAAIRENRTIDYTPVHDGGELTAEADPGWATLERIWSRTVVVLGTENPKTRITGSTRAGPAGFYGPSFEGGVTPSGWNIIQNLSQVTPQFFGDPSEGTQIPVVGLTELVVERFTERPGGGRKIGDLTIGLAGGGVRGGGPTGGPGRVVGSGG